MEPVQIRAARDDDADELIALIGAVFDEYPGCVLDVDGEMPELRAIASAFSTAGGRFWVAEQARRLIGCIGLTPAIAHGGVELRKLYVARTGRRRGLGSHLCGLVETEGRQRNAAFLELWTDTRFGDAHRLYERLGYVRLPETRDLHDKSATVEYHYRKELRPA